MRGVLSRLGVSALLAVGCSSSARPTASEQACAAYAAAFCGETAACRDWYVHAIWGDAATCRSRVAAQCLSTLGAPSTARTAASTNSCADALVGWACNDFLDDKLPDACAPKPGGLADGKACADGNQCASAFCTNRDTSCGHCAPKPEVGADCIDGCAPGLQCSDSGKCAATAPIGADCGADVPCTFGATCMSGSCVRDLAEGAACGDTTAACDLIEALFCSNGTCRKSHFAEVGATCGVEFDSARIDVIGFIHCAKSGSCIGYDPTRGRLNGTCVAPAADGEVCGGTGCLPPASCGDGVCKFPDPAACM